MALGIERNRFPVEIVEVKANTKQNLLKAIERRPSMIWSADWSLPIMDSKTVLAILLEMVWSLMRAIRPPRRVALIGDRVMSRSLLLSSPCRSPDTQLAESLASPQMPATSS